MCTSILDSIQDTSAHIKEDIVSSGYQDIKQFYCIRLLKE